VEETWKDCSQSVARKFFFARDRQKSAGRPDPQQLRVGLRLRHGRASLESPPHRSLLATPVNIIKFHETINGRPYVIEALSVGQDRWRAHLARTAGGTTALMPFYGATPGEAAQHLTDWLTRAAALTGHGRK
jgi:hypothetical protein